MISIKVPLDNREPDRALWTGGTVYGGGLCTCPKHTWHPGQSACRHSISQACPRDTSQWHHSTSTPANHGHSQCRRRLHKRARNTSLASQHVQTNHSHYTRERHTSLEPFMKHLRRASCTSHAQPANSQATARFDKRARTRDTCNTCNVPTYKMYG